MPTRRFNRQTLLALSCALGMAAAGRAQAIETEQLLDMSLEQLMNVEVTSVGKKSQRQSQAAAAIFVINQDEIRSSGATNIPDLLRMVPGVQVARIDSNKWAVTARGFNGRFAKNLLVMIDGRSVYSPTFSGVYWDMQDVVLADIERIEVIRGPGATLWGANAVNGVINIITKSASDTQGGLLSVGAGTVERGFGSVRYGLKLDEGTYARVYGTGFRRSGFGTTDGRYSGDAWDKGQGGFRIDRKTGDGNTYTLQGDAYDGEVNQNIDEPDLHPPRMAYSADQGQISGFNLLGRWRKSLALDSEISVQAYYDHAYKREIFGTQERNTYDIEMQHRFGYAGWHDIVWGLGYRLNQDRIGNTYEVIFESPSQERQLFSAFIQDEIALIEHELTLTLGSKLEHNEFTGFEGQPNVRLSWTPKDEHSVWASVSRAVRIPSRGENDARILPIIASPSQTGSPLPVEELIVGNKQFKAEELLAYEAGYRFMPTNRFSADLALFYNRYTGLRDGTQGQPTLAPGGGLIIIESRIDNAVHGHSYGAELAVDWKPVDFWGLQAAYSYLKLDLGGPRYGAEATERTSPQQQLSLRSGFSLPHQVSFNVWLRYVDRLKSGFPDSRYAQPVDDYVSLDLRLAWKPVSNLELSLVGQNLLDSGHVEFIQESFAPRPTQIPRSVYGKIEWRF